jgi:hypothetical protein
MQSHTKFKKFNDWMTEFLYPMITFAWDSLQENGILALNISDCYANHEYNRICQPLIDYCLSSLSNCSIQGVIGYEITSRKKNGVNAEPILFFTKGDKKINFSKMAELSQIQKSLDL